MRAERDRSAEPPLEFLTTPADPQAQRGAGGTPHGARALALVAAGALLATGLVLVREEHDHGQLSATPSSAPAPPTPSPSPERVVVTDLPSAAVTAAFARYVPGSIVVYERSSIGRDADGRPMLRSRDLRAVSGNVVITVAIVAMTSAVAPAGKDHPRIVEHGYAVTFGFAGYYPPATSQLRSLAGDPRLTAAS